MEGKMTEYKYRQFKIHYNVRTDKTQNLYTADGYISNPSGSAPYRKFHTEYTSKAGVQAEIKKLIEKYIDFEWREFYEMNEEAAVKKH